MTALAEQSGLADLVVADSAGTGSWHVGADMDRRARDTLEGAHYVPSRHRAKQFGPDLFAERDVVVALDTGHRDALWQLAGQTSDVDAARAKIVMLRAFDPVRRPGDDGDVPDPYYDDAGGFVEVLAQVRRSCAELLAAIADAVGSGADGLQHEDRLCL